MEERTLFEILLDKDDDSNVVLSQEDGDTVEFEQIATIVLDEHYYCILHPLTEDAGENDAVIFELDDSGEEELLQVVTDRALAMRIFDEYYKLLEDDED